MRGRSLSRLLACLLGAALLSGPPAHAHLLAARGGLVEVLREADALVVARASGASQDRVDDQTRRESLATDFILERPLSKREGTTVPANFQLVADRQSPRYAAGEVTLIAWKEIAPERTANGVFGGIGSPADALRLAPEEAPADVIPAIAALHRVLLPGDAVPADVQQALWRIIELDSPRYSRAAALDLLSSCHDTPVTRELAERIRTRRERKDLAPGIALLLRRVPVPDA